MKLILAVLFVFLAVALGANDDRRYKAHRMPHEVRFQDWMKKHNKQYPTQKEYETRLNNYIETTKRIATLNARAKALNSTAVFAHNKFSDLTLEEFSVRLGMKGYKPKAIPGVPVAPRAPQAPSQFDWRSKGGITAIKDQEQCGSCWAFSCTESIESVWMIKGGKGTSQQPLAPQQIVDCDQNDGGCDGGDLPTCYQYVQSTPNGLETNAQYPYRARDGKCNAKTNLEQDPISGFNYVIPQGSTDETAMASYLAANTPMSIIVDASSWSSYSGGVLTADECGQDLDHAVQAVGYNGLDSNGYWIVRNSWGPDWGENGFIRLQFASNTCGITSEVTVPTISN
jgi:C1A family cysteine protease